MRKIAIKMAGLVFYMAAGFVLLFWKLECGGLHNAELLLPLAWLAGAVALGLRLDKACKQAGRWGEAAHHFFLGRCAVVYKISKGCHSILKILMEVNSGVKYCHTHSSTRNTHGIHFFTINVFSRLIHITIFSFFIRIFYNEGICARAPGAAVRPAGLSGR